MKKHFKSISLCLLIAVGFSSCTTDDNSLDPTNLGGYAHLTDRKISVFDTNTDLNLNLLTASGVTVEAVEIMQDGSVIANAVVSGETASFNTSTLGALETGSISLFISSSLSNGKKAGDPASIRVADAISFVDTDDQPLPESVKFMDTTTTILAYSTYTRSATIDDVTLFWKKNDAGTYAESNMVLDVDGDEINLGDIDYTEYDAKVNDTLYYKFVANSGALSQEIETKSAILPQTFGAATNATLSADADMKEYNLGSGAYAAAGETGEMSFVDPSGFELVVDFVKATVPAGMTAEEYFNNTDLMVAEAAFNAGTKTTSVSDVSNGDVYIYEITRQNEDEEDLVYYGIIKIGNTIVVNGINSFEFKYAEGTIIRK
jgi:hypothetical protein